MNSREKILTALSQNKPDFVFAPEVKFKAEKNTDHLDRFSSVAISIGSRVIPVLNFGQIETILKENFNSATRILTTVKELQDFAEFSNNSESDPHSYENVDLLILSSELGVAENSALWLTEKSLGHRVLPFITQHLAIILKKENIVPTMHEAYNIIDSSDYGYGVFIAGPSKTADIEQSLVLGAHGPRSLWLFIM